MDWTITIAGYVTGGLASALTWWLLGRLAPFRGKAAGLLCLLAFLGGAAVGRHLVGPLVLAQQMEAKLLELRLYQALKAHEPAVYERVVQSLQGAAFSRAPNDTMWSTTRPLIAEAIKRRMPHASDVALVNALGQTAKITRHLLTGPGDACYYYNFPSGAPAQDYPNLLGKQLAEDELNSVADVLESAAAKTHAPIGEGAVASDLEAILRTLVSKHGAERMKIMAHLSDTNSAAVPAIDRRGVCELVADFYSAVVAMPAPRNANLVRFIAQN